jgi:ATP-dependent Clp protease, protease subunit
MKNEHVHEISMMPSMLFGYAESYVRLAQDRIIFLSEDITKDTAASLSALLLYYDHLSPKEHISLHINSDGGDVAALLNIYDVMQMISAPIITVCTGRCYSAAAALLSAGTKGERYAFKNSRVMIHGIQCVFPIAGHDQTTSKNYFEFLKDYNDNIMKILAKHTGHPLEKIKEDCKGDVFMDAKEALEYGLIDAIVG